MFRIDIVRFAGFTQLCAGQQRKAINMSKFSWMKKQISDTWTEMRVIL